MNILFISHETTLGGATLSMLGMIDEWRLTHKIFVLVRKKEGPLIDELEKRNINIIYKKYYSWLIPQTKDGIKGKVSNILHRIACRLNYWQALSLKSLIKEMNIEIIHSNTSIVNIGGILSELFKIPNIWHIREFGAEDFDLSFVFSEKYSYNFMEKNSKKIICVSKELKYKYERFISPEKIVTVYNGIRIPERYSRYYGRKKLYNILIAGRLSEAKGQKEAIEALKILKTKGITNIVLHLAGAGNIDAYKEAIQQIGLQEQVKFYGHIDYLDALRKKMDIELVCSRKEAFGRVTIEAMSHGLVVIGANTGGTKEIIQNGINGLLYLQGNAEDLAEKIEIVINNPEYSRKLALNGIERVHSCFSVETNAENIYKYYIE